MTPRSQLKAKAKSVLKPNYWKLVLVSLIFLLISGGVTGSNSGMKIASNVGNVSSYYDGDIWEEELEGLQNFGEGELPIDEFFDPSLVAQEVKDVITGPVGIVVLLVSVIAAMLGILFDLLLLAPLKVGCYRFFLVSQHFPAKIKELTHSFDTNYWNSVKTMFLIGLKIFLWSLLLVIPGIVKAYEYRMIPYLLAEHPDMSSRDLFAASRHLMNGNKWRAFVLDWSFILWDLLVAVTAGIVGLLYVNPYKNLTNAAFYEAVCREKQG